MEIRKVFNHRSSYYTANYGVVPDFKAGLHCGPVMVGEIGVVKRDIAFSGEVVGTAARIQNRCNHLEVNLAYLSRPERPAAMARIKTGA